MDLCHEGDSRLLDRFLAGSESAFRELVTRHGALVYGVCHRILRHRQDAEDAFQAVFLVLARRAADVWPRDAVGSWLYGVASRVALKARLLRARRMCAGTAPRRSGRCRRSPSPEPDTAEVIDRVVRKLPRGLPGGGDRLRSGRTLAQGRRRATRLVGRDTVRTTRAGTKAPGGSASQGRASHCRRAGWRRCSRTDAPVRAGLEEDVMRLISAGAGSVPAPVVALTEGVVPSMVAVNLSPPSRPLSSSAPSDWAPGPVPAMEPEQRTRRLEPSVSPRHSPESAEVKLNPKPRLRPSCPPGWNCCRAGGESPL